MNGLVLRCVAVSPLILLWACGPGAPTGDQVETNQEEVDDTSSPETAGTGTQEAMCTLDNYADHAELLDITGAGCVAAPAEGECPTCVDDCATSIVACPGGTVCYSHTTLCTEQLDATCCYLITAEQEAVGFVG